MSPLYIEGEPTGKWLDSENFAQWARELLARNANPTSDKRFDDFIIEILVEAFRRRQAGSEPLHEERRHD
jgi:hypothetical protein